MTWRLSKRWIAFVVGAAATLLLALPATVSGSAVAAEGAPRAAERSADVSSSSRGGADYDRFLGTALSLYKAASRGDGQALSQSHAVLAYRYRQLPTPVDATEDGMQALADQVSRLGRTISNPKPDEQALQAEAAAVYLAADAMARPDRPLWHDYRMVLTEDADALLRSLQADGQAGVDYEGALKALDRFGSHYATIRTAALLGPSEEAALRVDAALGYASTVLKAEARDDALSQAAGKPLRDAMLALFPSGNGQEQSAIVPAAPVATWGWSAMMGSFIVTVLTWVGWLRYRSEAYQGLSGGKKPPADRQDAAENLLERWRKRK